MKENILIKNTKALSGGQIVEAEIAVQDGVILSMTGAPEGFAADKVIDGEGKLCIPGLVNAHTHVYMSLFRNYADDVAFTEWLFDRVLPKEDAMSVEDAYWGTLLGCIEMIKSGTTTFCDMYPIAGMAAEAARKAGMRAVVSRGLTGSEGGERRIAEALGEWEKWKHDPMVTHMLAPHAIYTCDTPFLERVMQVSDETGMLINTHLSESEKEIADCYAQHGCSPVEYLAKLGLFERKTLAAHCVHLSEVDIMLLAEKGVSVAHNPKSNLKLANGIAPVKQMLDAGVNVCLGTDGAGSNNTLNMFSEMNFACLLPKGVNKQGDVVSAKTVLQMATLNGAKALSLEKVGDLQAGWRADIAILDLHRPWLYPMHDMANALCYSANGTEVETVLIDGEIVMEQGKMTLIDEEEVYANVARIARDW